MRIVVLDGYTENPGDLSWEQLEQLGELTVYDRSLPEEVWNRIRDAEIVFSNKTVMNAALLKQCTKLKYIGVLATGVNVVDLEEAKKQGIAVTNIPAYGTQAVAQFTMALILELCHHIGAHSDAVKQGRWSSCPDFCFWEYPLTLLTGRKMGIMGFGRIGRETARLASAFGMEVLVCSIHGIGSEAVLDGIKEVTFEEMLEQSDIISLHCPLTADNRGMICSETIGRMKRGVWLINTARGPLIQEQDLAEALKSGAVGGAALDVLEKEPADLHNPLMDAPNLIITPHIAWAPKEARQKLMNIAVENLRAFMDDRPVNLVNLEIPYTR